MNEKTPWINSNVIDAFKDLKQPRLEDDFYSNVNYNWFKEVKIKNGKARNSSFDELEEKIEERLLDIVTNNKGTDHNSKLIKHAYKLISDWKELDKFDYKSKLKPYLDHIDNIKNIKELTDYILSKECEEYARCILGNKLSVDFKNSDEYNITIYSTNLQLNDSAEYENITTYGERCKRYNDKLSYYTLHNFGYSDERIKEIIDNAFKYESMLAPNIFTEKESSEPDFLEKIYNRVTLNDLQEICKNFPIVDFLKNRRVDHSNILNLEEPLWLKRLDELYNESNLQLIKDYILRRVANFYSPFMGEKAFRFSQELYNEFTGSKGFEDDKIIFTRTIKNTYPEVISQIYINKYVDKNTKEDITNLIKSIIKEYRIMLFDNTWLSKETINKAVEKLDNLTIRAVEPDIWDNYDDLNIIKNESLFENYIRINTYFNEKLKINKINTKVDKEMWIDDVTEVNAYNSLLENSIKIIAGILDGTFYNKDMSIEEKLGGIGFIIAHEISHSFDTNGSKFDKKGNMVNWWKDNEKKEFDNKVEKITNYLNTLSFSDDGSNYRGYLVYTEMSADILAMKCILHIAKKITDFDYDKLFRRYAQTWKEVLTNDSVDNYIKTASHPLPLLRVNYVLQQYNEFYKTYNITETDKMYLDPKERISIW